MFKKIGFWNKIVLFCNQSSYLFYIVCYYLYVFVDSLKYKTNKMYNTSKTQIYLQLQTRISNSILNYQENTLCYWIIIIIIYELFSYCIIYRKPINRIGADFVLEFGQ